MIPARFSSPRASENFAERVRSCYLGPCFQYWRFWYADTAFAQLNTGTITGTVTDPSGALVPAVSVSIRNTTTNLVRVTATSSSGVYTVSNLMVFRWPNLYSQGLQR